MNAHIGHKTDHQAKDKNKNKKKPHGPRVPISIVGAFAEMPSDVDALAEVIALALAADHTQFFFTSAPEAKGMYEKRSRTAWGHAAHRVRQPPC